MEKMSCDLYVREMCVDVRYANIGEQSYTHGYRGVVDDAGWKSGEQSQVDESVERQKDGSGATASV